MKTIFDKTEINGMVLKNRFFRSALWLNLADEQGRPTERLIEVYENLAKGGIGTIITGFATVLEWERSAPNQLGVYHEGLVESYKSLIERVHAHGTNIILQLAFGGSQAAKKGSTDEHTVWAPSAVEHRRTHAMPKEMTKEDIEELKKGFATAALVAKKAGFDGVQLHAAHGYLLSQWLSPYYNRRTDEYGGNIENRARLLLEILSEMRKNVGNDFNIFVKINCEDFEEGGLIFEDSLYVCKKLSENGINAIEISGSVGMNDAGKEVFRKRITEDIATQSYFRDYAAKVAEEVSVPVILVGGNRDFALIDSILNSTNISYFSLARTLVCEPDLVNIWAENPSYKPKCVACNRCWSKTGTDCVLNRKKNFAEKKTAEV